MTEILTDLVSLILDAHLLRDILTFSATYLSLTFAEKLKFPQFPFLQTDQHVFITAPHKILRIQPRGYKGIKQ